MGQTHLIRPMRQSRRFQYQRNNGLIYTTREQRRKQHFRSKDYSIGRRAVEDISKTSKVLASVPGLEPLAYVTVPKSLHRLA